MVYGIKRRISRGEILLQLSDLGTHLKRSVLKLSQLHMDFEISMDVNIKFMAVLFCDGQQTTMRREFLLFSTRRLSKLTAT